MAICKVSVCIPTYNYGTFISETIESVLSQNYTDFELVIIDDNSTDDTRSIVEPYMLTDPRVRLSINPENLGMVKDWNLCLTKPGHLNSDLPPEIVSINFVRCMGKFERVVQHM